MNSSYLSYGQWSCGEDMEVEDLNWDLVNMVHEDGGGGYRVHIIAQVGNHKRITILKVPITEQLVCRLDWEGSNYAGSDMECLTRKGYG